MRTYTCEIHAVASSPAACHLVIVTAMREGAAMGPHEGYLVAVNADGSGAGILFGGGESAASAWDDAVYADVCAVADLMAPGLAAAAA